MSSEKGRKAQLFCWSQGRTRTGPTSAHNVHLGFIPHVCVYVYSYTVVLAPGRSIQTLVSGRRVLHIVPPPAPHREKKKKKVEMGT